MRHPANNKTSAHRFCIHSAVSHVHCLVHGHVDKERFVVYDTSVTLARPTPDRLQTDYRPTTDRLQTDYRPTTDRLQTDSRPTTDRLQTDYRPTNNHITPRMAKGRSVWGRSWVGFFRCDCMRSNLFKKLHFPVIFANKLCIVEKLYKHTRVQYITFTVKATIFIRFMFRIKDNVWFRALFYKSSISITSYKLLL